MFQALEHIFLGPPFKTALEEDGLRFWGALLHSHPTHPAERPERQDKRVCTPFLGTAPARELPHHHGGNFCRAPAPHCHVHKISR